MSPTPFREHDAGLSSIKQPDRVFRCCGTQVHLALRGREIRVPGELLDGTRGRPLHRQMRAERVPQDLHALFDSRHALSAADGFDDPIARER